MNKSLYSHLILVVAIFLADAGMAQQPTQKDSTYLLLRKEIDSLKKLMKDDNNLINITGQNSMRSINEDHQEFTKSDRRSKRKVIDSLLNSIDKNEIAITGQLMSVFHWDGKLRSESVNTAVGTLDLFLASSFGDYNMVFINLQTVGGAGPGNIFNSFQGFHAGAGNVANGGIHPVNVLEAWTQFKLKHIRLIAGKIDLTNYFDPNSVANDEYSQFVSNGLVNNTMLQIPGNGPGIVADFEILDIFSADVGLTSTNNDPEKFFEDLFMIVQLGTMFNSRDGQVGAIRVLMYKDFSLQSGVGIGASGDLRVWDKFYVFGRIGKNYDQILVNSQIDKAMSAGVELRKLRLAKHWTVTSGLGFTQTTPQRSEQTFTEKENGGELYIKTNFESKFQVSPFLQWVRSANGNEGENITFLGLRTRILF